MEPASMAAITAVYSVPLAGLRWHSCAYTELCTYFRNISPPESGLVATVTVSVTLHLPSGAASGTALWLISVSFRAEKLLLFSAEDENSLVIRTLVRFAWKTHWVTSSLKNFS
jgi:hypothetical protein